MIGSTVSTAKSLITGERNATYGDPRDDFQRTVDLYHKTRGRLMETPEDAVWFMVCVKMSRETNKHGTDNLIDMCGYLDIYNHLVESQKQTATSMLSGGIRPCVSPGALYEGLGLKSGESRDAR